MKRKTLLLLPALCLPLLGHADARPDQVWCMGHRATVIGSPNRDVLTGTDGPDVIFGGGGPDDIDGFDGADWICSGPGDDIVHAGDGNDVVRSGGDNDELDGGPGNDYLMGFAGGDVLRSGDGQGDSDTLVGDDGDDELLIGIGTDRDDYLFGGDGSDTLQGGDAYNWYLPGPGDDVIHGGSEYAYRNAVSFRFSESPVDVDLVAGGASGEGNDDLSDVHSIEGSPFSDHLRGDDAGNYIDGMDGDDVVEGRAGSDSLSGGPGNDLVDGGPGETDFITFRDSRSGVEASLLQSTSHGEGEDSVLLFESMGGSSYDDTLTGDEGPNNMYGGGGGSDTMFAGGGDDFLSFAADGDAGAGNDTCTPDWFPNCEGRLFYDPVAYSIITSPPHARVFSTGEAVRLTGAATAGVFGPEPKKVQFALTKLWEEGCSGFDADRKRFKPRSCGHPLWIRPASVNWAYEFPDGLPPGIYHVWSRIHQRNYSEYADRPRSWFEVR